MPARHGAKRRRNARAGRSAAARLLRRDGPWVALLSAAFAALCLLLVRQPVAPLAFDVEQHPPQVLLRNFYGNELNAAGSYRWAKPGALVTVPAPAPGDYRIVLVLGDTPLAGGARIVRVYANGTEMAVATLAAITQEVAFTYRYTPAAWARSTTANHDLNIELATVPFTPPQDDRTLGAIFYRATVSPSPMPLALLGQLLLGWLIVGLVYLALRLTRWHPLPAAVVPLLPLCGLIAFAAFDRRAALTLTLRLLLSPWPGAALIVIPPLAYLLLRAALQAPLATLVAEERFWSRRSLPLIPVIALAAGLRADHLNHLSLWSDEGYTLQVAQRPWAQVLGLAGAYDSHPPLHFALVKALMLVFPAASAGRILSATSGVLAVAVLYALAARLTGRASALAAALVLTIAPLHIWYSQEARMYAPALLAAGLSYLAVIGCAQAQSRAQRWSWALLYTLSLVLGMYLVYATLYVLLPQLALLGALAWRDRWRIAPLLVGGAVAVLAYLPWLPQLLHTTEHLNPGRADYLSPTPTDVLNTLLAIVGVHGVSTGTSYYTGLWEQRQSWLLLAPLVPALALGAIALARRFHLAALTASALFVGTITSAILLSLYSPGFAPRTTLFAIFGWALLLGAACIPRQPRWFMFAGRLLVIVALILPGLTWWRMREQGYKEPSRPLALAAADVAGLGQPIVVMDYIFPAFIAAYAPQVAYHPQDYLRDLPKSPAGPAALWLVYAEWPEVSPLLHQQLLDSGYARLLRHHVGGSFFVDFFARPGATLGEAVAPGDLLAPTAAVGWALPPGSAWEAAADGNQLRLRDDGRGGRAQLVFPAAPQRLYLLAVAVRSSDERGEPLVTAACLAAPGVPLERSTTEGIRIALPSLPPQRAQGNPDWHTLRVAVFCPRDTTLLSVALEHRGTGESSFRDLRVRQLAKTTPAAQAQR